MKVMLSIILPLAVVSSCVADTDCKLPRSVTTLFTGKLTLRERRLAGGEAVEHLLASCPKGPSDRESRALFFDVVDLAFATGARAGEGISDKDRSEAAWEGANQFEFDLRQYMDRIVNENDVEFKSVILKTANGLAISRLGPDVKYDVFRIANVADPVTVGAGHHLSYIQAFVAIGYWIDPGESRFASDEKREMTSLLLSKLSPYADRLLIGRPYEAANSLLTALAHSDSPEVMKALEDWSRNPNTTLRDEAAKRYRSVKARLAQTDR